MPALTHSPVSIIPTDTPGVAYVAISSEHCAALKEDPKQKLCASYLLFCDGRHSDGMHCAIPPEVARERMSHHPNKAESAPEMDLGVGTISNITSEVQVVPPPPQATESLSPSPTVTPATRQGVRK